MSDTIVIGGEILHTSVMDGGGENLLTCEGELADELIVIDGEMSLTSMADGDGDLLLPCDGEEGTYIQWSSQTEYTGRYEVTPSSETQVLPTANRIAHQNIVVNPIPSNYGLITWNGSTLTVS